jgi:hypothetical protein
VTEARTTRPEPNTPTAPASPSHPTPLTASDIAGLPDIPRPHAERLSFDEPEFVKYHDTWHLIGPASTLTPGTTVEVEAYTRNATSTVRVGRPVAARTVTHRPGSRTFARKGPLTTYIISAIDRGHNRDGAPLEITILIRREAHLTVAHALELELAAQANDLPSALRALATAIELHRDGR